MPCCQMTRMIRDKNQKPNWDYNFDISPEPNGLIPKLKIASLEKPETPESVEPRFAEISPRGFSALAFSGAHWPGRPSPMSWQFQAE